MLYWPLVSLIILPSRNSLQILTQRHPIPHSFCWTDGGLFWRQRALNTLHSSSSWNSSATLQSSVSLYWPHTCCRICRSVDEKEVFLRCNNIISRRDIQIKLHRVSMSGSQTTWWHSITQVNSHRNIGMFWGVFKQLIVVTFLKWFLNHINVS